MSTGKFVHCPSCDHMFEVTPEDERFSPVKKELAKWNLLEPLLQLCEKHGVRPDMVMTGRRTKRVTYVRHKFWYRLKWARGMSYPEIASLFGVDHSSVIHGVRAYKVKLDEEYRAHKAQEPDPD